MANHILLDSLRNNRLFFIGFFLWIIILAILQILFTQTELIFWVNRHFTDELDLFFKYATTLGEDYWYIPVAIYIYVKEKHLLKTFIIMWILKALLAISLKYIYNFPRPSAVYGNTSINIHFVSGVDIHKSFSFPSGHTMTAFALACFLVLMIKNKTWGLLLLFLAILVAYSRVYLFQHFVIDVFAGSILGVFVVFVAFYVLKWLPLRT